MPYSKTGQQMWKQWLASNLSGHNTLNLWNLSPSSCSTLYQKGFCRCFWWKHLSAHGYLKNTYAIAATFFGPLSCHCCTNMSVLAAGGSEFYWSAFPGKPCPAQEQAALRLAWCPCTGELCVLKVLFYAVSVGYWMYSGILDVQCDQQHYCFWEELVSWLHGDNTFKLK